jgi:hypothetical protein
MGDVPSARTGGALGYDATRHVTVLYSGSAGGDALVRDVWEWDGVAWHNVANTSPHSPEGRSDASFIYDPTQGALVLAGGFGDAWAHPNGTWRWDGAIWQGIASSPPNTESLLAFDDDLAAIVSFGGEESPPVAGPIASNQLFALRGGVWQTVSFVGGVPKVTGGDGCLRRRAPPLDLVRWISADLSRRRRLGARDRRPTQPRACLRAAALPADCVRRGDLVVSARGD